MTSASESSNLELTIPAVAQVDTTPDTGSTQPHQIRLRQTLRIQLRPHQIRLRQTLRIQLRPPDTITPDWIQLRLHQIRLRQTLRIQLGLHQIRLRARHYGSNSDCTGHYRARYDTPELRSLVLVVSPGKATVLPSYIGVAGNIGLGEGDSAVGGSFAVIKIGHTKFFCTSQCLC